MGIVASHVVISNKSNQDDDEEGNDDAGPLAVLPATGVPGAWQYRRPSGTHPGGQPLIVKGPMP